MEKRTTKDLVDDLMARAGEEGVLRAGLVVGFEDRTETVWSTDTHALRTLNGLLREGGIPVGLARFENGGLEVNTLPEFEGVEWAERYLVSIAREIMQGLALHLGVDYEQAQAPGEGPRS